MQNFCENLLLDTLERPNCDFNSSHWDFPNVIWIRNSASEISVKVLTLFPVVIFGIIANSALLFIIFHHRSMRTSPTNILIANMATADLLTLVICPLMFILNDTYQNYQLGTVGCRTEGFLQGAFLITSVLNLCGISYDRLSAIVVPLVANTRMTVKSTKIFVVISWITGSGLALPLIVYRNFVVRQWKNFTEKFCAENVAVLSIYWHIIIATLVWIPLIVMITSYVAIFLKLSHYEKQLLKRENPISVLHKKKITKVLFILLVTFVFLRVPFTLLIFWRQFKLQHATINQANGYFQFLWYISHYLMFVNAAVNPVIYGLMNGNFKRAFAQTSFCAGWKKTKLEDKRFISTEERKEVTLEPRDACVGSKL
ncbi:neuropeptide FF receptor 2 [Culicoides brevitarsis]|uniref:neuropeptide FF receptor 2 n=1 Tax=Culicoides brevitarsis TaxID=469753 RepID=UPI00307C4AD8